MARNFDFIKDITDRKDLRKIAVKVKDKWTAEKEGKEYFEMVVVDSKGDDIFVIVPHELKNIYEKEIHFMEIQCGKFREDFLYDIIGAVDEIGYTQPHPGSKKVQVNLKLKDLSDSVLHCTLWEDCATKFINFINGNTNAGPTIICMTYAKVKKEGKYPLTISNTWSTTRLFINDGLPEIVDFKKKVPFTL
ncbi:hypothetical protein P8452_17394 [Trifolium repens]|nr:hypothetical protein P8452_17394 [Trifolium repens]